MKTNKIKTIVTLCAVLVLASGGLYYLNHHQPSADDTGSAASSVAETNFGQTSSSASSDQSLNSPSNGSFPDSVDYSDSNTDFSNPSPVDDPGANSIDNSMTSTSPSTSTTGTVSAAQSSAIPDKTCIATGDTDYVSIDTIIKDDQGDFLVGDAYKPQANVSPLNGLTGNIMNISNGEWMVKVKSSVDQQVTAKIGSQGILITTLSLNFSSNCPPEATALGTNDPAGQGGVDSNNPSAKPTDTTEVISDPQVPDNTKKSDTAGMSSTTSIIYLVGSVIVLIIILAGGILLFLKKKQNNNSVDEVEEMEPQGPQSVSQFPPVQDTQAIQQPQPLTMPQQSQSDTQSSQSPQNPQPPLPPQV